MAKKRYEIDMCNGPILGKMLMFALPLMLSSMLQILFNAADIIVVGKFGEEHSIAAVGSTSSLINLLTNLFIGLSVGANVLVARYSGAKKSDDIRETVHTAMSISVICGIFVSIIGILLSKKILIWMNTPSEVLKGATTYLRIYFLGMPAMMVYNFGNAILRAVGDTKRPLYFLFVAGIVNVILNMIFVIVFKWDVAGVASSTVISQFLSAFLIIVCLMREKGDFRLDLKKLGVHRDKLINIIKHQLKRYENR
jgi:putative MATE family efflux protein